MRQRTRRRAAANGCGRWGAAGSSGGAVSRSRRWRPRGKVARRPWRASLATTRLLRAQQATLIRTSEEGRLRPPSFPARGRGATPAASLFCCRVVTAARPCSRQPDPTRLLSSTSCDSIQSQSCRRRYSTLRESIRLWAEERGRKGFSVGATRPHVNTEMSALWGTALHGLADQPRGLGIGKQSPGTQIRNLRVESTDLCRRRSLFMRSV